MHLVSQLLFTLIFLGGFGGVLSGNDQRSRLRAARALRGRLHDGRGVHALNLQLGELEADRRGGDSSRDRHRLRAHHQREPAAGGVI
ncbi:hypothetical protein IH879_19725 [candidate division KSB1 bacterium]|nr:hypothetical protein [candidate division KSB1 bacterium]